MENQKNIALINNHNVLICVSAKDSPVFQDAGLLPILQQPIGINFGNFGTPCYFCVL